MSIPRAQAAPLHVEKKTIKAERVSLSFLLSQKLPQSPQANSTSKNKRHHPPSTTNQRSTAPSIKMQISTYVYAAIAVFTAQAAAQSCLPNGNICTVNSNPPCCSGFCLVQAGQSSGRCQ
ncbi:hypothetical protein PG987_006297 [Apiospora arundinis]